MTTSRIGALDAPLGVHRGACVRYVDRLTVDEQRRHYAELAGYRWLPAGSGQKSRH